MRAERYALPEATVQRKHSGSKRAGRPNPSANEAFQALPEKHVQMIRSGSTWSGRHRGRSWRAAPHSPCGWSPLSRSDRIELLSAPAPHCALLPQERRDAPYSKLPAHDDLSQMNAEFQVRLDGFRLIPDGVQRGVNTRCFIDEIRFLQSKVLMT